MSEDERSDGPLNKYTSLIFAWSAFDDLPFNEWIIGVSESYFRAGVGLKIASAILDVRPAELQAALNLGILDDNDLQLLANLEPPKTTWFSLASASTEEIQAGIEALKTVRVGQSPSTVVNDAIKAINGPTSLERIASLSSNAFGHAARKAEAYDLLSEKSRKALKNWQSNIRTGKGLTPAQAAYAKSLFQQLADGGAIVRNSADEDTEICDEILDALEVE